MTLTKGCIYDDILRWCKAFITECKALNFSKNTLSTYQRQILTFADYCEEVDELTLKNIKQMNISHFFVWLDERISPKNATRAGYLRTLKSFFNFISKNNDDEVNYSFLFKSYKIKFKKGEKKTIKYFTPSEMTKILEFLDERKELRKYEIVRNSLLIKLMYFAGLRISEALNLKLCDFEKDGEFYKMSILAKGGEIQEAFIKIEHIIREMDYFKSEFDKNSYIFLGKNRIRRLTRETAYHILEHIYKAIGLNKRGCHILRHAFAVGLVDKQINLSIIQKALRHKSINTTMIYAESTNDIVKQALK